MVAFPTETVYGLGADILNEDAIRQVFIAKGRPADNPLIAHIAEISQIEGVARNIPAVAFTLIEAFFPGPLTLVLPKASAVPAIATAGLDTVGVRMPRHDLALEFIRESGTPIVAPSANLSGRPSPTTWQAVFSDLDGRVACILKGDQTEVGLESTVVDCTAELPVILRAGAITLEHLQKIVPEVKLADADDPAPPRSPGLKHGHYAPRAKVRIVDQVGEAGASLDSAYIGLVGPTQGSEFRLTQRCETIEAYAHELFAFFRKCDEHDVSVIYCQAVSRRGLGLALMDRLERASRG